MNLNCCKECPKKLKKGLLKMEGVYSVFVHTKENLVTVTGKVDPMMLMQTISKWGKTAELMSYEKEPRDENSDFEGIGTAKDKSPESGFQIGRGKDRERSRGYPEDYGSKKKEDHEFEAYVPLKVDEEVCRDPYCKTHKRRPIIHNKVPPRDSEDHPHHTQGFFEDHPRPTRGFFHSGIGNPMLHQRDPYQYDQYPAGISRSAYDLYSRRPTTPGYGEFANYGNRNAGGCNTM